MAIGNTPAPATDRELARRWATGDDEAFAQIHRRHDARLRRIARTILRDEHEAQDATQEAWLRSATWLGSVEEPGPWLAVVVRNEALRMLARRARGPVPVDVVPERSDPRADPAAGLEARETHRALQRAMGALPVVYREAVIRELAGQRPGEAAAALGITPIAARVRAHRARRMMTLSLVEAGVAA